MVEVWLTKGLFGEKVEKLADAATAEEARAAFAEWKARAAAEGRYKVEPYDRLLFREGAVAVDFGDYSAFALLEGEGAGAAVKGLLGRGGAPAV